MKHWIKLISLLAVSLALGNFASGQGHGNTDIEDLVSQLYKAPWSGAELIGESPTVWDFQLTEPMRKILEIGSLAKNPLLVRIGQHEVTDQVIFLLGGVGDETVIEPIINAMISRSVLEHHDKGWQINRAANLALTNITAADVIWHHGGGIVVERCRDKPKECWLAWWKRNRNSFTISAVNQNRCYSNYPNYGIYRNRP